MATLARGAWTSASLLALVGLGACAGDHMGRERPASDNFSVWDSAGVRVVESPGSVLESALPWLIDAAPNLELGQAVGGDSPTQFHQIRGIVGLPDGGLIVLDGGSRELRWFSAEGQHVRTTGGPGQGPGEFGNPLLVRQFQSDSLLIFDLLRRSLTWVATDGSGVRALGSRGELFAGRPRAAVGSRVLFLYGPGILDCPENELCESPRLLRWVDVDGTAADTLAMHVGRSLRHREPERPSVLVLGPLDQKSVTAAGRDGPVVEGDPRFELRQFDAGGRLTAIFRVAAAARETPREALDRYLQRYSDPDDMRRVYDRMLPDVLPAFESLRVDRLGWLWAELFRPADGDASQWLVFDPEGRAQGVVELPGELAVHEIGEDYVLGRWIDELGVEYVRRHTLDRRPD
jgi:hypothetical protein